MSLAPENAQMVFSEEEVDHAIDRMALKINLDLAGDDPVFVCVLYGGLPFTWDLIKRLWIPVRLGYVRVSSYDGMDAREPKISGFDTMRLEGKTVVLLDDILDRGKTLSMLIEHYSQFSDKVLTAVLLNKPTVQPKHFHADYVGLEAPDRFLIGRGMDFDGRFRELPAIYAVSD